MDEQKRLQELAGIINEKYDPDKYFNAVHKTYQNLSMYMKRKQWKEAELMAKSMGKQLAHLEEILSAAQKGM